MSPCACPHARAGTRNEDRGARERAMRAQTRFCDKRVGGCACALRAGGRAGSTRWMRPSCAAASTHNHTSQCAGFRHAAAGGSKRVSRDRQEGRRRVPAPPGTTSIMCSVPSIARSKTSPTPAAVMPSSYRTTGVAATAKYEGRNAASSDNIWSLRTGETGGLSRHASRCA